MQNYRQTPRMGIRAARLAELNALDRPLTKEERQETLWLANRLRMSEKRRLKYAQDEAYREQQKAKSRQWWRENFGYGEMA